jgi:DNA-binding NtrC family response regulator
MLSRVGGNKSEAARLSGVGRVTIWKRMKKYGIDPGMWARKDLKSTKDAFNA